MLFLTEVMIKSFCSSAYFLSIESIFQLSDETIGSNWLKLKQMQHSSGLQKKLRSLNMGFIVGQK